MMPTDTVIGGLVEGGDGVHRRIPTLASIRSLACWILAGEPAVGEMQIDVDSIER
ncbi:MAG: hypothetical protein U0Q03_20490 [Acidimicrobiales bacterium]